MTPKGPKIKDMGEFRFIRSIEDGCHFSPDRLIKGIGDDCAVIGPYEKKVLLISTDLLVEDIHFILGKIPLEHLGQKAVAVNLSDIAAMGGKALHMFISLAIPGSMEVETLHAIYRGMKAMCSRYRINILGGDTSASPDRLMINVTVVGEALEEEVLYRSGAAPGDIIYVTGTLGDATAGLKLIRGEVSASGDMEASLIEAHNLPVPFLDAGRMIAGSRSASALIDLSDGLLSDLGHVCEASGVGARLFHESLPLSGYLKELCQINVLDPYDLALHGGEDYRLLVTVPGKNTHVFEKMFEKGTPCKVYRVGEITEKKGLKILMPDGREKQLETTGFDHFTRT